MATETLASDHTSTDEQFEKVDEEANGQKSVSLSNENEGKHDKAEDAQGQATPSSKTEGEAKGYKKEAEHAVEEAEKSEDSPALEASAEDNLKHDKVEEAPSPASPSSKTEGEAEGDEKKAEPAVVVVEKIDGSLSSDASVADNLKEEKELILDSQTVRVTEPADDAAKSQPEEPPPTEPTESTEREEEKQPKTADIPEASAETVEILSNTAEANPLKESEVQVVKETEYLETSSQKVDKPEPKVTEVQDKLEEPERESQEKLQVAEQPNTVAVSDPAAETNEKLSDCIEKKTREPEFDAEVSKETNNYEAVPTETKKAEPVVTEIKENPSEPEKQSLEKEEEEQLKTVIHQPESESADKPGDIVEVHPTKESDIEAVKETGKSNLEAVHVNTEKPETVSTEVEEKPREQLEAAEIVITGNSAQVSLNEEAQAVTSNLVESSPAIEEEVVEEGGKKESICTISKEVVGVVKDPEQASINQEAKTDLKEEREYSAPISVEEKVAANDDKKQPGTRDAAEGSSREAEVEIKKVEEQNEAKTATTEACAVKAESVKDDRPIVDNEKQGFPETKVDEVRETLASKLEEKEEETNKTGVGNVQRVQIEEPVKTDVQNPEPLTKESDSTKTSKDLPKETRAKPAQKQSNNIISKVKQSLVRAKKAITGKSPTSKAIPSEAKGDIKVK